MITIEDIAKEAGVSIATVSRVINNNYPVSDKTREKVERIILKYDFRPNILAKGLVQKKTNTVGVLIPAISNMFFSVVVSGIQDYFNRLDFQILLCDTGGEPEKEKASIRSLRDHFVDGIIAIDPRTYTMKSGFYETTASEIPMVVINGYHQDMNLNFVLSDQEAGATKAMNFLLSKGNKNIGFLRGGLSYSYDLKQNIYEKILTENNIPIKKENILEIERGNSLDAVNMSYEAIFKRFETENFPEAFFCCNDWMALGALNALKKLGKKIPDEVSVIGYDNIIMSEISSPKITTVDQNMYKLGAIAAKRLSEVMNNPQNPPKTIYLENNLIIRESTGR